MKKWIIISLLSLLFSGICMIFWYSELRYNLPTPIPKNYHEVKQGEYVALTGFQTEYTGKPLFLHFFNPDCPCSRFNIPHFKSLVKEYGDKISFAIVVMSKDKKYSSQEIRDRFNLDVPISFEPSLAASCGVYSTPQAVLLDEERHLFYRGNYNKSRYCTAKESNYAQMAIDSLLDHKHEPVFNRYAMVAYGCTLPGCTNPKSNK